MCTQKYPNGTRGDPEGVFMNIQAQHVVTPELLPPLHYNIHFHQDAWLLCQRLCWHPPAPGIH